MAWHRVELGGLLGGHSGVDIDKGRANACIALARVLSRCSQGIGIAAFEGGSASNAIPRDASAIVGVARDREADFLSALQREADALRKELGESDPGMSISASGSPVPAAALAPVPSQDFLAMLAGMPNGLFSMEADMPGLVRSSSNLGTLKAAAADGYFKADTLVMVRSSSDEEKERYAAEAETRIQGMEGSGWKVGQHRAAVSPAWSPNMASPLLALAKDVYRETHGDWPLVKSTHGGLECGVFRPIFPHWDMISLGPDIRYPHSPDERVRVESVGIVYAFLKGLVERLQ